MSIGTSTNDQELIEPERVALDKLSTLQVQSRFDFNFEEIKISLKTFDPALNTLKYAELS